MLECDPDVQAAAPALAIMAARAWCHGQPAFMYDGGEEIEGATGMCVPLHLAMGAGLDPSSVMMTGERRAALELLDDSLRDPALSRMLCNVKERQPMGFGSSPLAYAFLGVVATVQEMLGMPVVKAVVVYSTVGECDWIGFPRGVVPGPAELASMDYLEVVASRSHLRVLIRPEPLQRASLQALVQCGAQVYGSTFSKGWGFVLDPRVHGTLEGYTYRPDKMCSKNVDQTEFEFPSPQVEIGTGPVGPILGEDLNSDVSLKAEVNASEVLINPDTALNWLSLVGEVINPGTPDEAKGSKLEQMTAALQSAKRHDLDWVADHRMYIDMLRNSEHHLERLRVQEGEPASLGKSE